MEVYKSFSALKQGIEQSRREAEHKQAAFAAARREALQQDQLSSAWRWFERNINYKGDEASKLRTVHSHGRKGTFKTLAPPRTRRSEAK